MIDAPASMPAPKIAFEAETLPNGYEMKMESNYRRITRVSSTVGFKASVTFTMNNEAYTDFRNWFYHDLESGTLSFGLPLLLGDGLRVYEAEFDEASYSADRIDLNWHTVQASVVLYGNQWLIPENTLDFLLAINGRLLQFEDAVDRLAHYYGHTLPDYY